MLRRIKCRFITFLLLTLFLSAIGCNQETTSIDQTGAQDLSSDKLLGSWTGYTVDQNASRIDQQMQQGAAQDAMKMQFEQQNITLIPGQSQPLNGQWKVISKDGENMKIAINLQEKSSEPMEFDIKFSSKDRFTMRLLNDGDPQTFTRIR